MKGQSLIITEYHPAHTASPGHTIHQTITTWLTKTLHQ